MKKGCFSKLTVALKFLPLYATLILFFQDVLAQNIQPLGIMHGTYEIKAGSNTYVNTYCLDKTIRTTRGTSYDRIAHGTNQKLLIGSTEYSLQQAIDDKLVSFKFAESDDYGQMYMAIKNNTKDDIKWVIEEDVVLSDAKSTNKLKNINVLNKDIQQLGINRQEYIWFAHGYDEYIRTNNQNLVKYGVLKPGEHLSVDDYIARRNDYLANNGISDKTLIPNFSLESALQYSDYWSLMQRYDNGDVFDWQIKHLIDLKRDIRQITASNNSQFYHLRLGEKNGEPYYFFDNGSATPYVTQGNTDAEIFAPLQSSVGSIFIGYDPDFPPTKRNVIEANILNMRLKPVEVTIDNVKGLKPFVRKGAKITKVSPVQISSYSNEHFFDVSAERANDVRISSESRGMIDIAYKWFRNLIGKNSAKSLADIYIDSKRIANKAYPGKTLRADIFHNYSSIHMSLEDLKDTKLNSFLKYYVYSNKNH